MWEEPFGRTAMESAAYGNATIISNRGGLPETFKNPIIINISSEDKSIICVNILLNLVYYYLNLINK
jgi:hypothetical protein